MKILFCSPEVYPYSKAGGVADFSASLPKALSKLNNIVNVVTPYHKVVNDEFANEMETIGTREILFDDKLQTATYYKTVADGINYYFVGHEFFNRDKFFGHDDDIKRYMFFNLAILELISLINFYPNIIHLNDWTTGLLPYFLDAYYCDKEEYKEIHSVLTIHNLEKQGSYPRSYEYLFTKKNFTYLHLDNINFLKTGIMRSSKVNTVSKSYRSEMLTKFFGFSLDGALKSKQFDLKGIQNGLDFELYNPETDRFIYENYNIMSIIEGKSANKKAFYEEYGFKHDDKMLVSYIGRFAKQKGTSLIKEMIDDYLINNLINFVVVGQGEVEDENYFKELSKKYPNNVLYIEGHKHKISQKVYAASDLLLMPSLFEASGLNQMIAMRYGTVPLVRETGGLKDTVIQFNPQTKEGTGFKFENFDKDELKEALDMALYYYENERLSFDLIRQNGMKINNNIDKMALEYNELYKEVFK